MVMYPASSSVVNCFERAESDISSRSLTKENSAQSVDASKATIDSRVLGWMSSSKRAWPCQPILRSARWRIELTNVGPPTRTSRATTTLAHMAVCRAPSAWSTRATPTVAAVMTSRKPITSTERRWLTRSPRMLSCGDARRPERTRGDMPAWTAPNSSVVTMVAQAGPKSARTPSRTHPAARKCQYQVGTLISATTCWSTSLDVVGAISRCRGPGTRGSPLP